VPGEAVEVSLRLNDVAHAFPPGHRLRLALSNAYWPLVWPSPEPVVLTLSTGESRLSLPVRPPDPADGDLRPFDPPERAPASEWVPLTRGGHARTHEIDPASGDHVARLRSGYDAEGRVALARLPAAADLEGGDATDVETRIHPADPTRALTAMAQRTELRRDGWSVAIETEIRITCTRADFRLQASLRAWEDGQRVCDRSWDERVPRLGL
jgi:hypothetical protein